MFSDSTLCVGVLNSDPSNNWATKLEDVWSQHGICETLKLAARKVQFIWHVLPGVSTIEIKMHIQKHLDWQIPKSFDERIVYMSKDIEWTKKGNTETCLHNVTEVVAIAALSKPKHWCLLGTASENTWWSAYSHAPQRQ